MTARPAIPLLLMTDYTADPLWTRTADGKGATMIPLDTLPLSAALTCRLRAWAAAFDVLTATDHDSPSPAVRAAFAAEGRALLPLVRDELGAGYDVELLERPIE